MMQVLCMNPSCPLCAGSLPERNRMAGFDLMAGEQTSLSSIVYILLFWGRRGLAEKLGV